MFSILRRTPDPQPLLTSQLYNQQSFYRAFTRDMSLASRSVIIESPFITLRRLELLRPAFQSLRSRGVKVVVNTRDPLEHEDYLCAQAEQGIALLQDMGALVLFTDTHHRKLAIIDDSILWEGSLNILSHNDSCEMMRRITSAEMCRQIIQFTGLKKWYTGGNYERL